jgi:DNA-binding MarR family transcriptional regulator
MVRSRSTVKAQPGLLLQPFVISQLTSSLVDGIVAGSEVSASEFALTSWLAVVGGATPSELAADLGLAPTTLSAMIERLVGKGQVRRRPHPEDGRSYVLELTARGRKTNDRNVARFGPMLGRVRAQLQADEREVLAALRALEAAFRAALAEPSA